jgi:hypothetical protein
MRVAHRHDCMRLLALRDVLLNGLPKCWLNPKSQYTEDVRHVGGSYIHRDGENLCLRNALCLMQCFIYGCVWWQSAVTSSLKSETKRK